MRKSDRPIPGWLRIPVSLYCWTTVAIFSILFHLIALILALPLSLIIDHGTRRLIHSVSMAWGRSIMFMNPTWRLNVEGAENIVSGKPYIIVANHQSMLDILVSVAGLPLHFKFMAKKEIFPIPFIGWHLWLADYIMLDRASRESGHRALLKARDWVRRGVSVLMFPEGTRSLDGEIHNFKPGAFKLALDEKIDILPIVINGTGQAIPKKGWQLERVTKLLISIGKPVSASQEPQPSFEVFRESIRKEMKDRLKQIRNQT